MEEENQAVGGRKRMRRRAILGLTALGFGLAAAWRQWPRAGGPAPALAEDGPSLPDALVIDGEGTVVETVDGDTVVLDDGRQVRLVGTQAPKLALGRANFEDWPLSTESRAALAAMVDGQKVRLAFGGERQDRHRRTLAHLVREADRLWIQGAMLLAGMSRVYTFPDNRRGVDEMLGLERQARERQAGIWDHPYYAIRDPDEAASHIGSFELVEGRVLSAANTRNGSYLNFGRNWSTDFTVFVSRQDRRIFDADSLDLAALEDRRVRVRGWIIERDGPMIEASHPEQIEVL